MSYGWKEHADTLARGYVPLLCESRLRFGEIPATPENLADFWAEFPVDGRLPTQQEIEQEAASQLKGE